MELGDDEVLIVTGVSDKGSRPEIGIGLLLIRENILLDDAGIEERADARQVSVEISFGRDLDSSDRGRSGGVGRIVGVLTDSEAGAVVEARILALGIDQGAPRRAGAAGARSPRQNQPAGVPKWTLPELREVLAEAAFRRSAVLAGQRRAHPRG